MGSRSDEAGRSFLLACFHFLFYFFGFHRNLRGVSDLSVAGARCVAGGTRVERGPCRSEPWRGGRPGGVGGRCFCSLVSGSWSSASVDTRVIGQSGRLTAALLPFLPEHETLVVRSRSCSGRSWFSGLRSFRTVRPSLFAAPCSYASGLRPGLLCGGVCSQPLSAVHSPRSCPSSAVSGTPRLPWLGNSADPASLLIPPCP